MPRNPAYVPARDDRQITLPQPHEMQTAADLAANMHGAAYFRAQMIQPAYSMIIFRGTVGLTEVEDQWNGVWDPMSIKLVNPWSFPIYVISNGDALSNGIPFPPEATLRLPLSGNKGSFVLAVNPTDIGDNDAIVHLFRYATPE